MPEMIHICTGQSINYSNLTSILFNCMVTYNVGEILLLIQEAITSLGKVKIACTFHLNVLEHMKNIIPYETIVISLSNPC